LAGMLVTGPRTRVSARYGHGVVGLAIQRRLFDQWLLDHAVKAGARFEGGLTARRPLIDDSQGGSIVRGLVVSPRQRAGTEMRLPAIMTLAADGRRSVIARAMGLGTSRTAPRRWAFGVYASEVGEMTDLGEMHIRGGWYAGLAPMPASLVNVCVVTGARPQGRTPAGVIRHAIAREPRLQARLADARFESDVRVLGPLAADVRSPGAPGLLLAGDAGGFVDPMTGDGLHLAMQSGVLAAQEALNTLESGDVAGAAGRLARSRRDLFGAKLRFNRWLRRLVESPVAVDVAGLGAAVAPCLVRYAVHYAGDAA
ncbi:MAG: FAD-dependent monooxygenase, partial [Acidobacteriota bacterium]